MKCRALKALIAFPFVKLIRYPLIDFPRVGKILYLRLFYSNLNDTRYRCFKTKGHVVVNKLPRIGYFNQIAQISMDKFSNPVQKYVNSFRYLFLAVSFRLL